MVGSFKGRVESLSVFLRGGIRDISGFGKIQISILVLKDGMVLGTKKELMIDLAFGFEGIGVGECLEFLRKEVFVFDLMIWDDVGGAEVVEDGAEFEGDLLGFGVEFG